MTVHTALPHYEGSVPELILPRASVGGRNVQIAPLQTVNLMQLRRGDSKQNQKLARAIEYPGCFYLELPEDVLSEASYLSQVAQEQSARCQGLVKETFASVEVGSVRPSFGNVFTAETRSKAPSLQRHSRIAEFATVTLLRQLNVTAKVTARLTMMSDRRPGATIEPGSNLITIIFPERRQTRCTTEILLPGTGLDPCESWAYVVPKRGCALVCLRGARYQVTDPLPGDSDRDWIEYVVS